MKTKKWMCFVAVLSAMMASSSCQDWGEADPPAAGQVYPKLENVAEFTFDDGELDPMQFKTGIYDGGEIPSIVDDETKGKVLSLNKGFITLNNPLKQVTVQNGASLTFWMKQNVAVDPETEEALPQDLEGALVAFENENATGRFFMTANGWLNYSGPDGEWSENNPAEYKTGYITPGEWHYVALTMRNDGYGLYVDGERKVEKKVDNFDCMKVVNFMSNVATLYIGRGSDTDTEPWMIDDLKLYRNQLTDKEIQRPRLPGESGPGGIDFSAFDYCTETPALTVGLQDCSGGWWTHFSNYYRIPVGANMRISFTNHTSGVGNWNNWNLCLCTDADRGADGYFEYFVLRSDLFGWGDAYTAPVGTGGYESGDWDKFRADMEGAEVVIDIVREGDQVLVTATASCADGTEYVEKLTATCGDGSQIIRAFLITDGSYLEIHKDGVHAFWPVEITTASVGASDNSSGFWTEFSDYFVINPNMNLNLQLINHTSGVGNWNNWNACVSTDADRGVDGYTEYFVVRSDLFGWGECYKGENWTSSGGYESGDWDKFRVDMEGADVNVKIERAGNKVTYTSNAVAATDGTVYTESIWGECGDGTQVVRAFLLVDGSHFVLKPAQCYTYVPVYK